MSRYTRIFYAFLLGGILGGAIGLFGAPAWEMAGLIVGPIGAISGAFAAGCAAHSKKGLLASAVITVTAAAGMAAIAQTNPDWVIAACTKVIGAAGVAATVCGFIITKIVSRNDERAGDAEQSAEKSEENNS